jgi:endonuclease/exonuclease/phosphatase (EEP) superfamily protein YafD
MLLFFQITSGIFIVFGLLALVNIQKWYIKIFDFAKFHISILSVLLILFFVLFVAKYDTSAWIFLAGLVIVSIGNFRSIFPFTPLHKKEIKASDDTSVTLSFLIANVRQANRHTETLQEFIKEYNPHAILLTEVDQYWVDEIAETTKPYEHQVLCPLDNTYGMALYSKIPLENAKVNYYVEEDIPSIRAIFKINDKDYINFFGLHPKPPAPWTKLLNKQAEVLIAAKLIEELEDPTLVAGDLNDVGWSAITSAFKNISGLVDPRIGRGFFNTYNAKIPFFRYPVDHLFVSDCFKLNKLERLGKFGSDHFPIFVEVSFEPKERKKVEQNKEALSGQAQV